MRDVKGMGRAHEAIETKDGYALNYLIPKKLAIPATPTAVKEAGARRARVLDQKDLDAKLLENNIAALAEANITIVMKANDKGHLYDAVAAPEISAAAKDQARIDLPENAIKLDRPIKELGRFDIPVSTGETFGRFTITIAGE
jgi:large subunit ribosomal protein L9